MVWTLLFGGVSSVVIAFAFSQPAGADPPVTVYAATSGTGDACSSTSPCGLQEAIDTADATSGAVVVSLAAGTYSGAFTIDDENTDSDASLTLSGGGPSSVILDGGGTTTPFTIASTNVVPVILEGATVENGSNTSTTVGGGVSDLASSGTLTVSNDAFTANAASLGGGLFSTVRTSISGSMFSDNSSSQNGAGALVGASATVSSSTFEGDSASGNGGGLEIDGAATLSSDAFTNNSAGYEGGGAYTGGLTDVIGCNFSANSLTAPGLVGAGLAAGGDGVTTTVTSSVFTHNMNAGEGNGAVFFGKGPPGFRTRVVRWPGGGQS
jgi:hypothetical protein